MHCAHGLRVGHGEGPHGFRAKARPRWVSGVKAGRREECRREKHPSLAPMRLYESVSRKVFLNVAADRFLPLFRVEDDQGIRYRKF